jgi:hypothetical protein
MHSNDDPADLLGEELMMEMADSFFGERRRLEDRLRVLRTMVAELEGRARGVDDHARFLFRVATAPEKGRDLLRRMNADPEPFPREMGLSAAALPDRVPSAFTRWNTYVKLLEIAYRGLRTACAEYMRGDAHPGRKDADESGPSYRLVEAMTGILNEEIEKINRNRTPNQVIRCAKRFLSEDPIREAVAGGSGGCWEDGTGLDCGMAFSRLDFDAWGLRAFPDLPPPDAVRSEIERFAAELRRRDPEAARSVLGTVREAIRKARERRRG